MLQLSASLLNRVVMSLRTGTPIAQITGPIINPDNLKIEGFYCLDKYSKKTLVLLGQDIREVMANGFVVNDHEVLAEPEDLVRLKTILDLNFELIGKPVETLDKEKVGKVGDYAVDTSSLYIQKLYVSQSILKSFTGGNLSIDRSQINEITQKKIIINDLYNKGSAVSTAAAPTAT